MDPGRFPADPGDWKRPGVSVHERGPCICWGPGDMKQGASHRPMSQRVKRLGSYDQERPGRHLLPFLKLSPAGEESCW